MVRYRSAIKTNKLLTRTITRTNLITMPSKETRCQREYFVGFYLYEGPNPTKLTERFLKLEIIGE